MKKNTVIVILTIIIIGISSGIAYASLNKEGLMTPYPHWHYFDSSLGTYGLGINPFYISGGYSDAANQNFAPNRGIGATGRQEMFFDAGNKSIFKYDMSGLGGQAWYVLQIANDWSVEFSANGTDWTLGGTNTAPYSSAHNESSWLAKPLTNESPYYFDLSAFLPANNLYVRIGDASPADGWGGFAYNALITAKGYPYFYAGGREPNSVGFNGDQQWLYVKDWTSDADNSTGRFADKKRKFVYKFDLPDGEDACWLHTRISAEYTLEVSTNSMFSTVDLVVSNNPGARNEVFLQLSLADVLAKTADNLIYVRIGDSKPDDGWGGNPKEFWISPHPVVFATTSFNSGTEDELLYLWYNMQATLSSDGYRYADINNQFAYRINFDSPGQVGLTIRSEYLVEGSSNNTDWITLFNAGADHIGNENILFDPFTGIASGHGAVTTTNKFCSNLYEGISNVFFMRISDCDTSDGWGGLVQDVTIMTVSGPSKATSAKPFDLDDHIISTSFFHWYTSTGGQMGGPWLPLEGRANWTGTTEWWKSQIKQVMLANIDVLYVHLIPHMDQQRINLFQALSEMRHDGYDVPKVTPFLDPIITWGNPTYYSFSVESNRTMLVDQYIRFFNQYYSVNTDEYADDYLAIIDNRVALDTWHLHVNFTSISSFHRNHMEDPLAAEFGADHPIFTNGIYMITTDSANTFSFADEKVMQFQNQAYSYITDYNGIKVDHLKPGYWDQNVRTPGTILKRDGGVNYSNSWATYPDALTVKRVYIESWNEYAEGSGIYAANPTDTYRIASNTSTDDWSLTDDPLEYIKTTFNAARIFKRFEINPKDSKIIWQNMPTNMIAGETNHCSVYVRNTGFDLWTSTNNYKFGQADTDSEIFGPGRYYFNDNEYETDLYLGVFKGRPVKFDVEVIAPDFSGIYETHWRMVQDGVEWFGEEITNTIYVFPIPEPTTFFMLSLFCFSIIRNRK